MDTIAKRLNILIDKSGMTKNKFADYIGTSSALISNITSKDIDFRIDLLKKLLAKYPTLNLTWLLTGIGEIFISTSDNVTSKEEQDYIQDMVNGVKKSPHYKPSQDIALKAIVEYSKDFKAFYDVMELHWGDVMRFMQFIYQYDNYFKTSFQYEVFKKAQDKNLSKDELQKYLTGLFKNLSQIIPIIKELNKCYKTQLNKLSKYDIEKMLNRKDWERAREFANHDYNHSNMEIISEIVALEAMFNLLEKKYPEL